MMSVYIDNLRKWGTSKTWRWAQSCHLFADTDSELHDFASKLGLKRAWFQNHRRLPHYDLNANRRRIAVTLGAIECDDAKVREMMAANANQARPSTGTTNEDEPC